MRQELYLIADEMRGMATLGREFAGNVYELERAHRMVELAARVAALADEGTLGEVRGVFAAEPWHRISPAIGVEAAVFDARGDILLVQRKDNARWAIPGGIAEIGQTPAEAALRELWEEAGLRGTVRRLLGVFDGRLWGSQSKVHLIHVVFLVECAEPMPVPGVEMLAARFFAPGALPEAMHRGHGERVPRCCALARTGETFFDPAASMDTDLPMHQRPSGG
ncbi:MAG: NUDIX domain-containing protein [Thermomicrobia bacterium]|nr:NUDIX domain-containing protein [Thermomicrobia bacterium]